MFISLFFVTYYLTHALMDYRQPIEPAILVLAVAGVLPLRHMRSSPPSEYFGDWLGAEPLLMAEAD